MKISGARAIVECIMEEGIDTVFGYPGGVILPFYDALQDTSLRHILTVHEQGCRPCRRWLCQGYWQNRGLCCYVGTGGY